MNDDFLSALREQVRAAAHAQASSRSIGVSRRPGRSAFAYGGVAIAACALFAAIAVGVHWLAATDDSVTRPPVQSAPAFAGHPVVYNATSDAGLARRTVERIDAAGLFQEPAEAQNWPETLGRSVVLYRAGQASAAQRLAAELGIRDLRPAGASLDHLDPDRRVQIAVLIGHSLAD
jgi:hypothetical protein